MDSNDYKNLCNIFNQCNLKIKNLLKVLSRRYISNKNKDKGENLNDNSSELFFFENNSLKFEQNFKFNIDIILNDICKITSLKKETVELILSKIEFDDKIEENEILDKELFNNDIYRKIKKKLIYDIALARIQEISELILLRILTFQVFQNQKKILIEMNNKLQILV